ncbi:MAG TPA: UDP-N-acetylglucosamine 1-carboxyvinyltransferase [Pirellulales bacterium]|jgi:UDP-N-acetylglucosamine 1-carboxyvinyltransferase|nr:UDP-N-acetylglucosamine 1-carboxyvinyltransferase [Pirellulales bacterium]
MPLLIDGGIPLHGTVTAAGSKNAALPIMAASILATGPVTLRRVPHLTDVATLERVLRELGLAAHRSVDGTLRLTAIDSTRCRASRRWVSQMRASFCVLGPLLARRRKAIVAVPGGCAIGARPIDLHLRGLAALGADIRVTNGYYVARARRLRGATIDLTGPRGTTVTGTANVMSAAVLARGRTVISSAAREPEIVDLGRFLITLGARIAGLGTSTIEILGVESLGSADHTIIPDRIEAATLLLAGAVTRGSVTVERVVPEHLDAVLGVMDAAGVAIEVGSDWIRASGCHYLRPVTIDALPYPAIPTDVQAQLTVLTTLARGTSTVRDRVFPERFAHVQQLRRFGADVERTADGVVVRGVSKLVGANVRATDLRASAALVLAGVAARGRTTVLGTSHLSRGYDGIDSKLRALGGRVEYRTCLAAGLAPRVASDAANSTADLLAATE